MRRFFHILILMIILMHLSLFCGGCRAIMEPRSKVEQGKAWININIIYNCNHGDKVLNAGKATDLKGEVDVAP